MQIPLTDSEMKRKMVIMNLVAGRLLILFSICLLGFSCVRERTTTPVLAESNAIALAKREFRKNGHKLEEYVITAQNNTSEGTWIVRFDPKLRYPPPGST